jgi:ATP-binding cassette subfamily F protein 3
MGEGIPRARRATRRAGSASARQSQGREAPEAAARQRESEARKPFEKRLAAIEKELEPLAKESRETEAWLATSEAYEEPNKERLQAALRRRGEVAERIATLEDDWLWAQAQMEKEIEKARGGPAA